MCFFYVAPFAYGAERDNVELSFDASIILSISPPPPHQQQRSKNV